MMGRVMEDSFKTVKKEPEKGGRREKKNKNLEAGV